MNESEDVAARLGILSIFLTVDGECNEFGPGVWSVFVRTRGCTVGCQYCDTKYSWPNKGGQLLTPVEVIAEVKGLAKGCKKVTITGGEPLEQPHPLLREFILHCIHSGFSVSVETSGTYDVEAFRAVDSRIKNHAGVSFVMDYKLGSAAAKENSPVQVYQKLRARDRIKFVIATAEDFHEAIEVAKSIRYVNPRTPMFFSPAHGVMSPRVLVGFMRSSGCPALDIRLNLQLHKYIWPDDPREEENGGFDATKRTLGRDGFLERAHTADEKL